MGWPVPTRATDFFVEAVHWNADLVANMNALMHPIARKTTDQSIPSSTTLTNDTQLVAPVLANEIWQLTWNLIWKATTAGDMKFAFTFPSAATVTAAWNWLDATAVVSAGHLEATTSPTATWTLHGFATEFEGPVPINMLYVGGANAGNITLQWAQNTSDATPTIMKTNSTVWGAKLA